MHPACDPEAGNAITAGTAMLPAISILIRAEGAWGPAPKQSPILQAGV